MRTDADDLKIFSGRHGIELTRRICDHLDLPMGVAKTEVFPDGELLVRVEEDVRGRDCFVVLSTCSPVNDNLLELLIFVDCLRRASARCVTVVTPYFGYGRQDRKDAGRVPITAKLVANLVTQAGTERVLALDLHAAQIQGFFDIPVDHLTAMPVFCDYFLEIRDELGDLVLVSPDVGNVKVAEQFANRLDAELAIINKRRNSGTEVTTGKIIGDVKNKTVLMVDDMITTAGTVEKASRVVLDAGATDVVVAATHPVLVGPAVERLGGESIRRVVCSNTIPSAGRLDPLKEQGKYVELCVAGLLGEAIHRIHHNQSVSALFRTGGGLKR